MKFYAFALFLFFLFTPNLPVKSGYIKFENVGNSDKQIATVIISTDPMPNRDFQKVVLVDPLTFDILYKFVDEREERYRGKRDATKSFAFEVTTFGDNLIGKYFLPTQEKSVRFFNELLLKTNDFKDAKGVDSLQRELRVLLKRISI